MIGPFTIDSVFPAFTRIGAEFGQSEGALQQLVSAYLAAFAIMSIFHGPLSDALGRRRVMLVGLTIYVIAMFACVVTPSFGVLVLLRVLQGASAGAATIISRVMVRDLFSGAQAQRLMAQVMAIFSIAPALAPVLGGWLLLLGDWRWVFAGVGLYGVLALVVTLLLPETLPPERRTPLRVRALLGSLAHVGASPLMIRLAVATAFGFAAQSLFIASAQIIVVRLLGLGEQDFWVLFVPLIIGMFTGAQTVGRLADRMPRARMITIGYVATVGATAVNLLLVALAPAPDGTIGPSLIPALVGPLLIGFTVSLVFAPLQLEIMDLFPRARGSAASLGTFFSLVLNALLAGVVAPLVTGSLTTLGASALAFAAAGTLLWSWHLAATRGRGAAAVEDGEVVGE
ncbi:Bcr/CflA family drug resistance efflux transporter [Brachybacterium endophyticum]|uniref:Bcr/CflA family drug resistance efflux transporter n=2 Tax=Brachybacterium endophyticum TaxID=2182385 RepID=A0A2U2RPS7_9MICO|nr:Bcr/CflA family drug resistance efflux transporter [Brachybacterium endophyticum]